MPRMKGVPRSKPGGICEAFLLHSNSLLNKRSTNRPCSTKIVWVPDGAIPGT